MAQNIKGKRLGDPDNFLGIGKKAVKVGKAALQKSDAAENDDKPELIKLNSNFKPAAKKTEVINPDEPYEMPTVTAKAHKSEKWSRSDQLALAAIIVTVVLTVIVIKK